MIVDFAGKSGKTASFNFCLSIEAESECGPHDACCLLFSLDSLTMPKKESLRRSGERYLILLYRWLVLKAKIIAIKYNSANMFSSFRIFLSTWLIDVLLPNYYKLNLGCDNKIITSWYNINYIMMVIINFMKSNSFNIVHCWHTAHNQDNCCQ
jgi:hypothetical protein